MGTACTYSAHAFWSLGGSFCPVNRNLGTTAHETMAQSRACAGSNQAETLPLQYPRQLSTRRQNVRYLRDWSGSTFGRRRQAGTRQAPKLRRTIFPKLIFQQFPPTCCEDRAQRIRCSSSWHPPVGGKILLWTATEYLRYRSLINRGAKIEAGFCIFGDHLKPTEEYTRWISSSARPYANSDGGRQASRRCVRSAPCLCLSASQVSPRDDQILPRPTGRRSNRPLGVSIKAATSKTLDDITTTELPSSLHSRALWRRTPHQPR